MKMVSVEDTDDVLKMLDINKPDEVNSDDSEISEIDEEETNT